MMMMMMKMIKKHEYVPSDLLTSVGREKEKPAHH